MSHFTIEDGVMIKYEKEKDRLRMAGGAWSINLDELKDKPDSIRYITEKNIYSISYADARLRGFVRVLGGEHKLVVPLKYWQMERNVDGVK